MTTEEFINSIKLDGEEWRVIPNWERYAVSTFGRVASLGLPYMQAGILRCRKPQLLTPRIIQGNPSYYEVRLSDGKGYTKAILIHRLVAITFIPNPNNYKYVNHKDENTFNNTLNNLEWCTQQYNCNYGTHNQRMAKTLSQTAYQRKPVIQLSLSDNFIAQFNCIREAAKSLGISESSISLCCRKKKPFLCGYKWMYLEEYSSLVNKSKNSQSTLD